MIKFRLHVQTLNFNNKLLKWKIFSFFFILHITFHNHAFMFILLIQENYKIGQIFSILSSLFTLLNIFNLFSFF